MISAYTSVSSTNAVQHYKIEIYDIYVDKIENGTIL